MRLIPAMVPFFLFIALFAFSGRAEGSASASAAKDIPEGCLWGIFMENTPIRIAPINRFDAAANKKSGSVMFYIDWQKIFPLEDCQAIVDYGAIPHVTWEPWIKKDGKDIIYLDNIINGQYDEYIRTFAKRGKRLGTSYFLRMGHEMDGNWYPWSGAQNDKDPKKYIRAWRHVYDLFREVGADNAIWVWCVMDTEVPWTQWNTYSNYYPGDNYVDWVSIDGYNWGTAEKWSRWNPFEKIFAKRYKQLTEKYPGKPIMIGEFASGDAGGDKEQWIKDAFVALRQKFPRVKAIVWFNIKKECDWRLHGKNDILKAFSEAISDPYFKSDPVYFSKLLKGFRLPEGVSTELRPVPQAEYARPVIEVIKAAAPVTADGNLSEWEGVAPVVINDKRNVIMGQDIWKGPDDISAEVYLMWDETNLYVAAKVKDDKPFINDKRGDAIWNGDSFEIAFSLDPKADPDRMAFDAADYQIGFGTGNRKEVIPQRWSWQLKNRVEGVQSAVYKPEGAQGAGGGYVVEAVVPWKSFSQDFVPAPGMKVSFNAALNDSDTKDRHTQMVLSGDERFYEEPCQWGFVVFMERGQ